MGHSEVQGCMFYNKKNPAEMTVVDADGFVVRRFSVAGFKVVSSIVDPYDNVTPITPPIKYTQLKLIPGKTATGTRLTPGTAKFITNSSMYASSTKVLCVDADKNIVLKDEAAGTSQVVLSPKAMGFELTRFKVSYYREKDGKDLSAQSDNPFPSDKEEAKCINVVLVSIGLKDIKAGNEGTHLYSRSFSVPNFSVRQPAGCSK